jgi:type IV secretion system protein VirB10
MTKEQIENFDAKVVEVDDGDPSVAPSKGGRMITIIAVAFVIAVGLYFFVLSPGDSEVEEVSEEIVIEEKGQVTIVDELPEMDDDFTPTVVGDGFEEEFRVSEVPELPELSEDIKQTIEKAEEERKAEEEAKKLVEAERLKQEEATRSLEEKIKLLEEKIAKKTEEEPIVLVPQKAVGEPVPAIPVVKKEVEEEAEISLVQKRALAQRKGTAMLTKKGSGGPKSSLIDSGGIILSGQNTISALEVNKLDVTAKRVQDLTTTILQGKLIYGVLETAINTDLEGTLRAIVNRDVYAEKGKNILISKGSRLIGTYQSGIQRGQHRLMITWNRVIRTDGVEIAITSKVTDQFGRSGLQGTVDNKYVEILGNSLLTSLLTIATAIATEEAANTDGFTNTTSTTSGDTTQSGGNPSDFAIVDATQAFMDTAKQMFEDAAAATTPTMRIPQGTKLIVFVNQDLSIPPLEKQ